MRPAPWRRTVGAVVIVEGAFTAAGNVGAGGGTAVSAASANSGGKSVVGASTPGKGRN